MSHQRSSSNASSSKKRSILKQVTLQENPAPEWYKDLEYRDGLLADAKAEADQISSLVEEQRDQMRKLKQTLDKSTVKKYQEANATKNLLTNI